MYAVSSSDLFKTAAAADMLLYAKNTESNPSFTDVCWTLSKNWYGKKLAPYNPTMYFSALQT